MQQFLGWKLLYNIRRSFVSLQLMGGRVILYFAESLVGGEESEEDEEGQGSGPTSEVTVDQQSKEAEEFGKEISNLSSPEPSMK